MFIVKLGGSVITDKTKKYFFKPETMDRLALEIKKADSEIIIVHGAGSFGHILAEEYQLNDGFNNDRQIQGFSLTHAKVQELNNLVLKSLHLQNIPAVSIPPHAILKLNERKLSVISLNIFKEYLEKGFTPVTFGDVALDKKLGFSICSGDLLVQALVEYYKPEVPSLFSFLVGMGWGELRSLIQTKFLGAEGVILFESLNNPYPIPEYR